MMSVIDLSQAKSRKKLK